MKTQFAMEKINTSIEGNNEIELLNNEIPGSKVVYYTIEPGASRIFEADTGYYHILVLIKGDVDFETDKKTFNYNERVTIVPDPKKQMTAKANSSAVILEIRWDIAEEDTALLEEYKTEFPVVQPYATSIQYVDPNKSEKTISRMMIPHKIIPRFAIGSVESYGYDYVKPHSHPMLDQFFFSFPENDMDVLINGEPIRMLGNVIIHIPLGADHGVEVTEGKHMHYMWIDFLPDNELGLKRLDERHKVTGTMRSFDHENK